MPNQKYLFLVLLAAFVAVPSYAYVDPGNGYLLWQILVAGIAGSLFFIRKVFSRISGFFGAKKLPTEPEAIVAPDSVEKPRIVPQEQSGKRRAA